MTEYQTLLAIAYLIEKHGACAAAAAEAMSMQTLLNGDEDQSRDWAGVAAGIGRRERAELRFAA